MKYLKVFTDFMEVTEPLSDAERGRLFMAMLGYALDGREPALSGNERFLWTVAKQHIDREREAYEGKVSSMERAREHRKQAGIRQRPVSVSQISREDKEKDKDNDKDKDKDSLSTKAAQGPEEREKRPTLEEVRAFSQQEGLQTDVDYFYSYYEANGWHIGKYPIRDWKAALRAWTRKTPDRPAKAKEPMTDRELFQQAIELHRMKGAKQV